MRPLAHVTCTVLALSMAFTPLIRGAAASADGVWKELSPPTSDSRGAVLDPTRHVMISFGGDVLAAGDLLVLSTTAPHTWQVLPTVGAPLSRSFYAAIYDPLRDRYILFGGLDVYSGQELNEVWALTLSGTPTWTQLLPAGTAPGARQGASAIYDPVRDRMIVVGGMHSNGVCCGNFYYSDTWALSLSGTPTWTPLPPSPVARGLHTAVYDRARDRMLVYGGMHPAANEVDVFSFASGTWSALGTTGGPPEPRSNQAAAYDPVRDRMVISGGDVANTWALSLSGTPTWNLLPSVGEPAFSGNALSGAYEAASDAMFVYDGDAVRRLTLGAPPIWTKLNPGKPFRIGQSAEQLIHDTTRDRWIVIWGTPYPTPNTPVPIDTWAVSFEDGQPEWVRIDAAGTRPDPRNHFAAIYDPVRDRIVLFGGVRLNFCCDRLNDVWALTLSGTPTWTHLTPAGTGPGPCEAPAAVYDAAGDRMIIWGGWSDLAGFDNTTWTLNLAGGGTWSTLPGPAPPGRFYHAATLDATRGRMLIFGGRLFDATTFGDTWALSLPGGGWQQIGGSGGPGNKFESTIGYDPLLDRMIVLGGFYGVQSQAWSLSLASNSWSQLAPTGSPPRSLAPPGAPILPGGFDATRHQMLLYDGELAALSFEDPSVSVPKVDVPNGLRLAVRGSNPSRGSIALTLTLPERGSARLELVDVAGRRLASRELPGLDAGSNSTSLDVPAESPPGLYWLRLTQAGRSVTARVVFAR